MRRDGRIVATLPAGLDPKRTPHYGPGGHAPGFSSVEEAGAWLAAEIARRMTPRPPPSPRDERLGAYLARWFAANRDDWPDRTVIAYQQNLRRWEGIGDTRLGDLTRLVVQDAVSALRRATWVRRRKDGTPVSEPRPYARRTIQQALGTLHLALEDLVPDVLPSNPAVSRRRRSRRAPDPEQPVWSAEQAQAFLTLAERLEPRVALGFRLILRRALRIGEVAALRWDDLDERSGTLRVDQTAPLTRKGEDGPTKTRRTRDVPLSADLLARLKAHRRQYPATDPHVFTLQGEPISVHYLRELWHRVIATGRLPRINPKDGRASCATILLDEGWPLPRVAALLGHTSIATTSAFYARVLTRRQDQVAQLGEDMDRTFDRAGTPEDAAGGE